MTKLGRAHFNQKLHATELDEVSIDRRERVTVCQQDVKGFAGADEICDFFSDISHGVIPMHRKTRSGGRYSKSNSLPWG
jgi:hypothetical protein